MMLEASERNVEMALEWAASGLSKLYSSKAALKFAEKFAEWAYKSEAEKAGWKFAAEKGVAWALS
jgi:hypothetical protein